MLKTLPAEKMKTKIILYILFSSDSVTISAEVFHTEKSHSDAVDVELSLACSVHTTFGTYSSTLTPQNVTKHRNHEILLKVFFIVAKTTHSGGLTLCCRQPKCIFRLAYTSIVSLEWAWNEDRKL